MLTVTEACREWSSLVGGDADTDAKLHWYCYVEKEERIRLRGMKNYAVLITGEVRRSFRTVT